MDSTTQILIQKTLETLIAVLVPILVGYLTLAVRNYREQIKERVGAERWYQIEAVVTEAVKAAEQSGLIGAIEDAAAVKKQWAIEQSQRILNEKGITNISTETLALLIEAKVRDGVHKRWEVIQPALSLPTGETTNG